jgi:tetratricopeptide (TPR) repeat protein
MNFLRVSKLAACFAYAACLQFSSATIAADLAQVAPGAKPAAKPAPRQPNLPAIELSEDLMYRLMLVEIAVQRGQIGEAVPEYLKLVRETRDPRIAQRATELAWNARMVPQALEAASLWLVADPGSPQARQVVASLLVNQERIADAQPHLDQWLASDTLNIAQNFIQLTGLLVRHKDKAAVTQLIQALARPYDNIPEVRLAVAQTAWNANDADLTLTESRAALKLKPDFELAALVHAQALQQRSPTESAAFLREYLNANPKANDARLNYARLLVQDQRFPEARQQFEQLLALNPKNPDIALSVALLAMQAKDYDSAEPQLQAALANNHRDPDLIRFHLGQVNEDRTRYDQALKWFGDITHGEHFIAAQSRYAGVLAKQGKLAEGRAHLQKLQAADNTQRQLLVQAEGNLLREANQFQEAYDVLGNALAQSPDAVDLLYDQAMISEKINRVDVLENNLRKVIKLQPDHAHAYNALGYTFADRNERLPEARTLIETALKYAPNDAYIIDSMGWVLFRMGQTKAAVEQLRRAYSMRPDAEVGAHLGEVLWADGQRDEARKILGDLLKDYPKNDVLQGTIKRLAPNLFPAAAR